MAKLTEDTVSAILASGEAELLDIIREWLPYMISDECEPEMPVELWMALGDWAEEHLPESESAS